METGKSTNGAKDGRYRNWAMIVYPESAIEDWVQSLSDQKLSFCVSPLHDKDIDEGKPKKPHYHVILSFQSKKSYGQVSEIAESINALKRVEVVKNMRGHVRYLLHLDNPEKAQYSRDDLQSFGGFDANTYLFTKTDKRQTLKDTFRLIKERNIDEYSDLIDLLQEEDLMDMFEIATETYTLAITRYINSIRHKKARGI